MRICIVQSAPGTFGFVFVISLAALEVPPTLLERLSRLGRYLLLNKRAVTPAKMATFTAKIASMKFSTMNMYSSFHIWRSVKQGRTVANGKLESEARQS